MYVVLHITEVACLDYFAYMLAFATLEAKSPKRVRRHIADIMQNCDRFPSILAYILWRNWQNWLATQLPVQIMLEKLDVGSAPAELRQFAKLQLYLKLKLEVWAFNCIWSQIQHIATHLYN